MSKENEIVIDDQKKDGLAFMSSNIESLGTSLASLKSSKAGINIIPEYYEFTKDGEKVRGIFLGFQKFEIVDAETGEFKILDSIVWIDQNKKLWSNAGVSLVGAMRNVSQNTPIEIEFIELKKVAKGKMKVYSVRPLIIE